MSDKIIVGIDIGIKGAVVRSNGIDYDHHKMPVKTLANGKETLDGHALKEIILHDNVDFIVFEDLRALYKAGKSQTWSLAYQSGAIEMMCIALNIPYLMVAPKFWQAIMFEGMPPLRKKTGETDTKAIASLAARKLFPNTVFNFGGKAQNDHDGLVDARLLEAYGRKILTGK